MTQQSELTALLERIVRAPSLFYRERLATVGKPTPDLWQRVPITSRDEVVRDQLAHLPHGTRRCADAAPPVRAGSTGTGADLLVLTWTAADLARERVAGARLLGQLGVRAGMAVANTLRGALVTPGALLLGDVIEEIGGLDVPLGAVENDAAGRQAWELVDRVQPAVLIVDHASAARLFAATPPAARPWLQGIVWLHAAAAETSQFAVPDTAGFAGWQRKWLAVPEATSFVAHSCGAGRLHCDEGVVVEVVDDMLVLTPLGVDTPLLRYASGWRVHSVSCSCGTPGVSIDLR